MKKLFLFFIMFLYSSCALADQHCNEPDRLIKLLKLEPPTWYLNPPPDTEIVTYGVGFRNSRDLNLAKQFAVTNAQRNLACKKCSVCTTSTNASGDEILSCIIEECNIEGYVIDKMYVETCSNVSYCTSTLICLAVSVVFTEKSNPTTSDGSYL